jgi:hypothetical protein
MYDHSCCTTLLINDSHGLRFHSTVTPLCRLISVMLFSGPSRLYFASVHQGSENEVNAVELNEVELDEAA